jgi:2,5-dihydroxypyridine 5,6-dioxygenase
MVTKEDIKDTLNYWVDEYLQAKKGEEILITADHKTNKLVLEVLPDMITKRGARVTLCIVPAPPVAEGAEEGSHIGERFIEMAPSLFEARKMADKLVDLGGVPGHNPFVTALDYEYKARRYHLQHGNKRAEYLLTEFARYPRGIMFVTAKKVFEKVRAARNFRLTHPWGTDLTFEAIPGNWGPPNGSMPPLVASGWGKYRLGRAVIGCNAPETCNGVVVSRYSKDLGGDLNPPVSIKFVDGWATEITGGETAAKINALIADDRGNRRIQELMMGLNPKASAYKAPGKLTYDGTAGAGNIHVAIGREVGRYASSQHITPAFLPAVTLYADGEYLIKDGRLTVLDDPEVRQVAAKYGDPDKLLSQVDL